MSTRIQTSFQTALTNKPIKTTGSRTGVVVDIILNETHDRIQNTDEESFSGKDVSIVGSCVIRPFNDTNTSELDLLTYLPYDNANLDLPLIGEVVELINVGNILYYKRITNTELNTGNAFENANKDYFPLVDKSQNTAASYNTTSQTGIPNTSDGDSRDSLLGKVFSSNQANQLTLYDGDKIIQSRYGQSIRFSAYNNVAGEYAPTILIRNRQNDISLNKTKIGDIIEEDINRDGTTIAITSGAHKLNFQPGIIDEGGASNFETNPDHFESYPNELSGYDQVLINTDRIILSAKSAEMIFYSKGNWGFISDGKMSIDNGKAGADLNFNGNINITTNDNDFSIIGGNGSVYLNTDKKDEPLARAATLVDILGELIDEITKQIYATPSGPTATGPANVAAFKKIKSKLDTIKSTLNFTE